MDRDAQAGSSITLVSACAFAVALTPGDPSLVYQARCRREGQRSVQDSLLLRFRPLKGTTMTDTDDRPAPPGDLAERGRAFWRATLEDYDLTAGELALLAEACRTMDNLDALASAIRDVGAMTTGSMGQPVVNAALTEARGQRLALHRLLAALALPDVDGDAIPTGHQQRAQAANAARWKGHTSERQLRAVEDR